MGGSLTVKRESTKIVQSDIDTIMGKKIQLDIMPVITGNDFYPGGAYYDKYARFFQIKYLKNGDDTSEVWHYSLSGTSSLIWDGEISKNSQPIINKISVRGFLTDLQTGEQQIQPAGWFYKEVREYITTFTIDNVSYIFTSDIAPFRHVDDYYVGVVSYVTTYDSFVEY